MRYRQNTKGDILYGPPVILNTILSITFRELFAAVLTVMFSCILVIFCIKTNQFYVDSFNYRNCYIG